MFSDTEFGLSSGPRAFLKVAERRLSALPAGSRGLTSFQKSASIKPRFVLFGNSVEKEKGRIGSASYRSLPVWERSAIGAAANSGVKTFSRFVGALAV
ncbi:MAG: hypothetical protein HFG27_07410 [Provencibacterium sp.]|jgi:hypothetical protein|nr:hypothetical protein [Provencibacterium sp.]